MFLWVFLALQVLFAVWVVGGLAAAAGDPGDCGGLDADTCNTAYDLGVGVGVAAVVALWVAVDIVVGAVYAVVRLARHR